MAEVLDITDLTAPIRAAAVLLAGGIVVLPTDTVYGLAANAADPAATRLLFERKGRGEDTPLAVLCADAEQAFSLAGPAVAAGAHDLARRHWPGPLTLVVPRRPGLDWALGTPAETVGVRCPDHDFVRSIARAVGPIATTSANRHGVPTPPDAADAAAGLIGPVDLVIDGGTLAGTPSTVVDVTSDRLRVLRAGTIEIPDGE